MIPTSVRVCDSNFFQVRSDVRVRVCVGVFKFCIHIRMDTFLYPDRVFKSIEVHTDNIQTDTGQTIFEHYPDGQTPDSLFSKNPDKIPTADRIEVEKIRTDRHQTAFFLKIRTESGQRTDSRQTESGQTDTRQPFSLKSGQNPDSGQIRDRQNLDRQTPDRKSGQQTDTGQDFPENPDKNETRTGHGQCCPPTSGWRSF